MKGKWSVAVIVFNGEKSHFSTMGQMPKELEDLFARPPNLNTTSPLKVTSVPDPQAKFIYPS